MKKIIGIIRLCILCISSLPVFASDWNLPGIKIISRAERGAEEKIRYAQTSYADRKARLASIKEEELKRLEETDYDEFFNKQKSVYESQIRNDYLLSFFAEEQEVDAVIYEDGSNYIKRPQSYHYKKSKIIVHHTAGDTSAFTGKESVISYLKDVYKYHAITRGRGDVGYNFLIDPYGNIYEGRAGGDSVVGAHTSWNNTPSIGISLMGNFEKQQPTPEQIKSLVNLTTILSKKYNIDPTGKTRYHKQLKDSPYMKSTKAGTIAGHKDSGNTSCPGKNLYTLLPKIRDMVVQSMAKGVLVNSSEIMKALPTISSIKSITSNIEKGLHSIKSWQPEFDKITKAYKESYMKSNGTKSTSSNMNKITAKITISQAKDYINSDISVLLYELSTKFFQWNIACTSSCSFETSAGTYQNSSANIEVGEGGLLLTIEGSQYTVPSITISASEDNLIEVKNYNRTSLYKIPRNTFYGSLTIEKGQVKNLKTGKFDMQYLVINTLPFQKYLKGIVETNDNEHKEKIKVMNLISKGYALFYKDPKNKHQSIPAGAKYTAIDSPEMFQKYVGAGVEKTLKTVPALVDQQKDEIIVYKSYLPILPYFNCSVGFTWSGKDKRGWSDTPYLVSRIDLETCDTFNGHGVGLSGKGAQYFAKKGWTYKEIINYYYPGVKIINL